MYFKATETHVVKLHRLLFFLLGLLVLACQQPSSQTFQPRVRYKSDQLRIEQISEHAFVHVSFLQTKDFGKVACNGLIVDSEDECMVFDTPTNDSVSKELIRWIRDSLHCTIKAIVPTHFHHDCLGGLKAFHDHHVPSYANQLTIELAQHEKEVVPQRGFQDSLSLPIGSQQILLWFPGQGHTRDNIVAYFPSEQILFGGCLIKCLGADKGYLGDADTTTWSRSVDHVMARFPELRLVVPGHGDYGNTALLQYTRQLFQQK